MKLLLTTVKTDNKYTEYALRSLYSVVAESPIETELIFFDSDITDVAAFERIVMGQYNIIYLHCDEYNEERISRIIEMVKKAAPNAAVVAGGMEVSFDTMKWMKENPWVDYVIRGEGEIVLYRFLRSVYSFEFDFEKIPGLAYRNGEAIVINRIGSPADMDDLPFVYDHHEADADILYYESMRGSSERNAYEQFVDEEPVRTLSIARVCRELRYFEVKAPKKVVFFDRCFNCDSDRAYRIFDYLINNDNGITSYEFNISGDRLDDETARILTEARKGLFEFNIDVPSTTPEVLKAIGHKENIYQLMYNVTKLLQAGTVKCRLSVMAGLPHESVSMFGHSFNKVYGLADGAPFGIHSLSLLKGSALLADADGLGYEYTSRSPHHVISSDAMSAAEIIHLKKTARVADAYIGDGGFRASLPRLMNDTGLKPFELFTGLTDYIYREGCSDELGNDNKLGDYLLGYAAELYEGSEDSTRLDTLAEVIREELHQPAAAVDGSSFGMNGWDADE